ncbi:MAG: hypothetical protein V4671_12980 [Armatimonadota bacterium]
MNIHEAAALSHFIETHDNRFRNADSYSLFPVLGQDTVYVVEAKTEDNEPALYGTIPAYVSDALSRNPDLQLVLNLKQWLLTIKQRGPMP